LTEQQRREHYTQRDIAEPYDNDDTGFDFYQDEVLRGRATADISHAGEALQEDTGEEVREDLLEGLRAHHQYVSFFLIENLLIGLPVSCLGEGATSARAQTGHKKESTHLQLRCVA
jgi:hypothetical protein